MIKNIIFDIGGVILEWDLDEMLDYFANNEEEKEFIRDNIFYTQEWAIGGEIDIGYITQYDFVERIQKKTNHINDKLVENFILGYYKLLKIKEEVIKLIKDLKERGYSVYILSNTNDYIVEKANLNSFLDIVDGYILSYQVHEVKPNEVIYRILIDKYKLNEEESLFIDDNEDNIKTANKLGIKGRTVIKNSYDDIINILKEFDII